MIIIEIQEETKVFAKTRLVVGLYSHHYHWFWMKWITMGGMRFPRAIRWRQLICWRFRKSHKNAFKSADFSEALSERSIRSVQVPWIWIKSFSFRYSSIQSISIPWNVEILASFSFRDCKLTSFIVISIWFAIETHGNQFFHRNLFISNCSFKHSVLRMSSDSRLTPNLDSCPWSLVRI